MEREGVQRVKMFLVITAAYVLFWGPLFFVTLVHHPALGNQLGYEVRHRQAIWELEGEHRGWQTAGRLERRRPHPREVFP
jgi:hypothetical protein